MDLLATTSGIVRNLKKFTYEQQIEVLDLARKQFDHMKAAAEKAAKDEASKQASAPQASLNSEGVAVQ